MNLLISRTHGNPNTDNNVNLATLYKLNIKHITKLTPNSKTGVILLLYTKQFIIYSHRHNIISLTASNVTPFISNQGDATLSRVHIISHYRKNRPEPFEYIVLHL